MTDPGPGAPLTDVEQRSWVSAVDKLDGHYLGDMSLAEVEEMVASMLARCGPDSEWAPKVADAIRARWRLQRGEHIAALWARIKRNT